MGLFDTGSAHRIHRTRTTQYQKFAGMPLFDTALGFSPGLALRMRRMTFVWRPYLLFQHSAFKKNRWAHLGLQWRRWFVRFKWQSCFGRKHRSLDDTVFGALVLLRHRRRPDRWIYGEPFMRVYPTVMPDQLATGKNGNTGGWQASASNLLPQWR